MDPKVSVKCIYIYMFEKTQGQQMNSIKKTVLIQYNKNLLHAQLKVRHIIVESRAWITYNILLYVICCYR